MITRRVRRRLVTAGVVMGAAVAIVAGGMLSGGGGAAGVGAVPETEELAPALAARLGQLAAAAPGSTKEGDRGLLDQGWVQHATPGLDRIPNAAIAGASSDWAQLSSRGGLSRGNWKPLGPTWAKGLPNQYRDRNVYNSGTPDFTGRIAHTVIEPDCRSNGNQCRLWIANANGGVWRTDDALAASPRWTYLSEGFGHNNVASLELDPNDSNSSTIYAGTGEPNACGSGCEAGVGIYKSTNRGNRWTGPFGQTSGAACAAPATTCNAFYNRAVGSIEVKPGDSNVIFAASGRAIRGLNSACCGGVDALIPGAAHFGLYRSLNGGQSWELVNQGAPALCTGNTPDEVSLNATPCSARGARRVMIDPVDPNTVYATFFAKGIWRSNANGNPGTWTQILAPLGPVGTTERAEFDLVELPNGDTRMFVGVGGGAVPDGPDDNPAPDPVPAQVLRSNSVRVGMPTFTSLTNTTVPGFTSFGYCDPQCVYDNYIFAPAGHFPNSGASPDVVYLLGDNEYNENDWGPQSPRFQGSPFGQSSARGVALSTNAGAAPGTAFFTDMTEDTSHNFYPVGLHPDHHAIVVNPTNYKQFITVGDGGVARSNGNFVNDAGDCGAGIKGYVGIQLQFCQLMLSSVPERLQTINEGLRTLHFYSINVSPHNPDTIVGGTQDNGSWERGDAPGSGTNGSPGPVLTPPDASQFPTPQQCLSKGQGDDDANDDNGNSGGGGRQVWVNTNIADGGHNVFDIGDPCFRLTSFQVGQMFVHYEPKNQLDANWIADTLFLFYAGEANAFVGVANDDPEHEHWLWTAREHVFRSTNQGRNPVLTKQTHRENCNLWYGDFDLDDDGDFDPAIDICDDWKPLGDPGPDGRLSSTAFGGTDRQGGYTAVIERANDNGTIWAATQNGRVFVSTNADAVDPATVVFDRIDDEDTDDPPRFPTAIYVDPSDPNHAWITYSGFNAKTPGLPGHVFEVRYDPDEGSTFEMLDGVEAAGGLGDIPATSIAVSESGVIYVGTDFGVVASTGDGRWSEAAKGLPRMPASDLEYVPSENKLYVGTHGQGAWELKV